MARSAVTQPSAVALVCGEDDFGVRDRARQIYAKWSAEVGGSDHEIIDASVSNSGQALEALKKLREALQTLPFCGSGKVLWLKDWNFLSVERTASAQDVTSGLSDLAEELKAFPWDNVRLLIRAGKVDKRKVFYRALDKLGTVETLDGLSMEDKHWTNQATVLARTALRAREKEISEEALAELISRVGPNAPQIESEIEKLALYVGERKESQFADVAAVCSRNKNARAFALGDALGDRDLPALLRRLDEELWEVRLDPKRSEIGLLYGLISKVRAMILLKEMMREGWIKPEGEYGGFKAQLERVPAAQLPGDKRFNPLALNPYVLYKALPQAKRYSQAELVRAMDLLLQCNRRLVSSTADESLVLQQTFVSIISKACTRLQ